jgi:hypothetical protein
MNVTSAILLPVNQFDHFYRGGDRIGALRHGPGGPRRPEEWIGSTTARFGQAPAGLTVLPDGKALAEDVSADPEGWLGPAHVARYGPSTELLVKLLDLDQRLPVHLHPTRAFSRTHLGLAHGKTEAWYVLDAPEGARVGVGFAQPMSIEQVRSWVMNRDSDALLSANCKNPPIFRSCWSGRGSRSMDSRTATSTSVSIPLSRLWTPVRSAKPTWIDSCSRAKTSNPVDSSVRCPRQRIRISDCIV